MKLRGGAEGCPTGWWRMQDNAHAVGQGWPATKATETAWRQLEQVHTHFLSSRAVRLAAECLVLEEQVGFFLILQSKSQIGNLGEKIKCVTVMGGEMKK